MTRQDEQVRFIGTENLAKPRLFDQLKITYQLQYVFSLHYIQDSKRNEFYLGRALNGCNVGVFFEIKQNTKSDDLLSLGRREFSKPRTDGDAFASDCDQ